jgi:hypothetical protein
MGQQYPMRFAVVELECGAGKVIGRNWKENGSCGSMREIHGMAGKIDTVRIQFTCIEISINYF